MKERYVYRVGAEELQHVTITVDAAEIGLAYAKAERIRQEMRLRDEWPSYLKDTPLTFVSVGPVKSWRGGE